MRLLLMQLYMQIIWLYRKTVTKHLLTEVRLDQHIQLKCTKFTFYKSTALTLTLVN